MSQQKCPNCGITKPAKCGQFDRHDPRCSNRERCNARRAKRDAKANNRLPAGQPRTEGGES